MSIFDLTDASQAVDPLETKYCDIGLLWVKGTCLVNLIASDMFLEMKVLVSEGICCSIRSEGTRRFTSGVLDDNQIYFQAQRGYSHSIVVF